jgi:hypothetical protein
MERPSNTHTYRHINTQTYSYYTHRISPGVWRAERRGLFCHFFPSFVGVISSPYPKNYYVYIHAHTLIYASKLILEHTTRAFFSFVSTIFHGGQ